MISSKIVKPLLLSLFLISSAIFNTSLAAPQLDDLFQPERGTASTDIPTAEQAFVAFVENVDENGVTLHWFIAPQTYLYQKSLKFNVKGAVLGSPTLPPGDLIHDPFFGDVTVYYHNLKIYLPFETVLRENVVLTITYQGCHEAGICYPPQTDNIMLNPTRSFEQANIQDILKDVNIPLILLVFFGLGFLLALTPCVLPMVPILSALIIGEQQKHHRLNAFYLAITYVIFMAFTYAGLGAMVSSFGTHIQAQLQNPIILSITAAVLLIMAFLLINDKALHIMTHLNGPLMRMAHRMEGGKFIGVAMMGIISALVISPCVTPPLVGALTYITLTGDVMLGSSALFALAIGMGVPLIAVTWLGTAILPKRGRWMQHIKHVFSVLLIGMAIYLFSRFLPGNIILVLWGMLFIGIAFWIGVWPLKKTALERIWQALAWLALLYGTMSVVGAGMGNEDIRKPISVNGTFKNAQSDSVLQFTSVRSVEALEKSLADAQKQHKRTMVYFYADWCTSCGTIERFVFTDSKVQQLLADVVLIKADITHMNEQTRALMDLYQVFGPPAFLFFSQDGKLQTHFSRVGEVGVEDFTKNLESWQTSY